MVSATAKYWLYFLRGYPTRKNPIQLPRTIAKYVFECSTSQKRPLLIDHRV
jgi:hypothetical protein